MLRRLFYPMVVSVMMIVGLSFSCFAPPPPTPGNNFDELPIDGGLILLAIAGTALAGVQTTKKSKH